MHALDAATGQLRPSIAVLLVATSFLISFLTPYVTGRLRRTAAEELPPGARPRRQWAVSGLGVMLAFAFPVMLLGGDVAEVQSVALLVALAGFTGLIADVLALPRSIQVVLGLAVAWIGVASGIRVEEIKPPFTTRLIPLGDWSTPASIVWLLAVAYAVVLCRRLPKLTAGLVAIVSLTFAIAALLVGPSRSAPAAGLLGLALAASAAGAARPGYPSLGSAAHWAMGFALGAITIVGFLKNTAFLVIGVPLLALGVPVGETTYAIIYGAAKGRQRLALGQRRELLHEALIRTGLSPQRTVLIFQAATAYLCAVALLLSLLVRASFLIKLGLVAVALGFGFIVFFLISRILSEPKETGEERVDMLGVPIARIDMNGALARVEQFVEERRPHMIVTSDTPILVRAHDDQRFQEVVRSADIVTADGRGVVWMARVLGLPIKERVSGADLVERICQRAAERGYSVYLIGAQPGVADEAARVLQSRYPGLRIAGTRHGYFTRDEEPAVVSAIAEARPDVLLVAFGAPKQELWIREHLDQIQAPVAIGVGGTFDVLAGRVKRAPQWVQQAGLEWLYRALREPKRIPRLMALPRLVWMTLKDALRRRGE
jgi:N-acetylglucosaminyldiphosphoundecaprenol N-acetyl-beta-D-mannosaminyltransferase